MGNPRQNPASFTSFTFADETAEAEITAVKAWQHKAGDSPPNPNTPVSLPLTQNGNLWSWPPPPPAPPPAYLNDINGVYFMFQGANGWSQILNVGWAQQIPNRMSGASVTCSGGSGQYTIEETVNTATSIPS